MDSYATEKPGGGGVHEQQLSGNSTVTNSVRTCSSTPNPTNEATPAVQLKNVPSLHKTDLLVQSKWFIQAITGDIRDKYDFEERIGQGSFGSVYKARDKQDGQHYAVKSVVKERMQDLNVFINEINIMRELDHPNTLQIYEIWETDEVCSLVGQYMQGGDLLNLCNCRGLPIPEQDINIITRQLLRALVYLHGQGVVHADIKLENCLFESDQLDSLHLIDFGLSMNFKDLEQLPEGVRGTLNYMAPEILLADRSQPMMPQVCDRTDVWAAGVVLYTLACGELPFKGTTQKQIIEQMTAEESVMLSALALNPYWLQLNPVLRDLILQMLRKNPHDRLSACQVLCHPWFVIARNKELKQQKMLVKVEDLKSMAVYGKIPVLKKITMMYLSVRLDASSSLVLKQKFQQADSDQNGSISMHEFNDYFAAATGDVVPRHCTDQLFEMLDSNQNGKLDFSEFKAAMLRTTLYLQSQHLRKAFHFFDRDNSGTITKKELQCVFRSYNDLFSFFESDDFDQIIAQADLNQDGKITYQEFVTFMTRDLDQEHFSC